MQPVYYLQNDSRWGKIPYTKTNNPKQTIGSSGCGVTSAAMILSTWVDYTMKPDYVAKLALNNGFRTVNNGTDPGFFNFIAKKFGLNYRISYNTEDAINALKNGSLVICAMSKGYFTTGGHYILAYDYDGANIIVNDPASTKRTKASKAIFKAQCVGYYIFNKPVITSTPHWGIELIKELKIHGYINSDHNIDELVTWGQLAKVACIATNIEVIGDINSLKPYINALIKNKVILSYHEDNIYITWGELAKVACFILNIKPNISILN
jgi:hypothetical protein